MTAFEKAWDSIIKMPWLIEDGIYFDENNPSLVEGPLYSGGDKGDDPVYWTTDLNEALAYALFGSAIPRVGFEADFREQVPMRETIPRVLIAEDPGYGWRNKEGGIKDPKEFGPNDAIDNYMLYRDPESDAYMADFNWGPPEHKPMSQDKMRNLLLSLAEEHDDMFAWGTTGRYKTADERKAHIKGALERLETNTRGKVWLDDAHRRLSQTSETDGIEHLDEDYLRVGRGRIDSYI